MNASAPTIDWLAASTSSLRGEADTRALTSAIASGDTDAFARFYRSWFDPMYAEARRVTGRDESFCLDVVQEAMIRVIRALKPMDTTSDLERWTRVVVRSCAYDRLRLESRQQRRQERAVEHKDTTPPPDAGEQTRRLRWLEEQLAGLDDRHVQLLLMRHRFGWTLQQIARVLGETPGAVDGRLRRLVRSLRRRAREESDE